MDIVQTLYGDNGAINILTDGMYYYVQSAYGTERVDTYEEARNIAMEV